MTVTDIDLQAAFPGSMWVEAPAADRTRWCLNFMRALWGEREGWCALASGIPHLDNGKYRHRDFRQHFHRWPNAQTAAADEAIRLASHGRDVYVAPMLRTKRERTKGDGAGGRFAWVDCDGELTIERRQTVAKLGDACRIVFSGTGHHIYVELDDWQPLEAVVRANRALVAMLDGDAKWSDESLLRAPGTFNRKPIVFHGEAPTLVQKIEVTR